jgi:ABC-type multidrug transport system fused ATPase/permease subunit
MLNGVWSRSSLLSSGLLGVAVVIGALLRQRERVDAERLGQHFVNDVRDTLFRHLGELSPRAVAARDPGGLLLRFVGDLNAWRSWISLGVARGLVTGLLLCGVLIALTTLHWLFGLAVAMTIALGALVATRLGHALVAAVRAARKRRARLTGNVNEKLNCLSVVQLYGQRQLERRRLRRQGERLRDAMVERARWIGWLRALADVIGGSATLLVLLLGSWLVSRGELGPAAVAAALSVTALLLPGARDLARVYEYWQGAQVAREKAEGFLALDRMSPTSAEIWLSPRRRRGALALDDLTVDGLFDRISATARAGERIALTGANASGKSTLLALIARLHEADGGQIKVDGVDLERMTRGSLRRAVGLASTDAPLLRGTVLANIRYGEREENAEAMAEISELCALDALAAELPKGLETRVRDHGRNLSLGQRQRIVLARALLLRPRVLLLDEMGTNFDHHNRALFERLLADYPGTVLYVSHDPALQSLADRAWHLADGQLDVTNPTACPRHFMSTTASASLTG